MWLGKGDFDNFGYMGTQAFIKGHFNPNCERNICYLIDNNGHPSSADQFSIVPLDHQGKPSGPPAYKTAGQVLYSTWAQGANSAEYNISNELM